MRVVLDTNVFVSGVFFFGSPGLVLNAWRDRRLTLVYSPAIFEEYDRVFTKLTEDFSRINPRPILDFLVFYGEIVHPANMTLTGCRDPADDKFVECLLASKADCLISGDRDLLEGKFEGCSVLSPRQFCDRYL
jgi:putative PIN family toxin of toxin-antitoxin system